MGDWRLDPALLRNSLLSFLDREPGLDAVGLWERACTRFPSAVSRADVKAALGVLQVGGAVSESPERTWKLTDAGRGLIRDAASLTVAEVLRGIRGARPALKPNDGSPLYTYRLTQDELHRLKLALNKERKSAAVHAVPDREFSAALVLFASHYLCRHFTGGSWSWSVLTTALDWQESVTTLYRFVETGLAYFSRPLVRTNQTEYLMTLVCEGGLPLGLLKNESNNRVRLFFRAALSDAERRREPAAMAVRRNLQLLPTALQNETVHRLAAALLDSVVALRAKKIAPAADPVPWLDANVHGWRANVPLTLDDEVAAAFLNGLLRERTSRPPAVPVFVSTTLAADRRRLLRTFNLPAELSFPEFRNMFQMTGDLPGRIYLNGKSDRGEIRPLAIGIAVSESECFRLRLQENRTFVDPLNSTSTLGLVAMSGGEELGRFDPPGGAGFPADCPWIFEEREASSTLSLVAVGSAAVRGSVATVVVPSGSSVDPPEAARHLEMPPIEGRTVFAVRMNASVAIGSERYTVRLNDDIARADSYFFIGKQLRLPFTERSFYLGLPRLFTYAGDEAAMPVPDAQIQLRSSRSNQWFQPSAKLGGELKLRVISNGRVLFRRNLTVLPNDFRLELSVAEKQGWVRVHSEAVTSARLVHRNGELTARSITKGVEWSVTKVTERLRLLLSFSEGMEAEIDLPSPITQSLFVRADGSPLKPGKVVGLSELARICAHVATPDSTRSCHQLEARLKGGGAVVLGTLRPTSHSTKELNLLLVERLVAAVLSNSSALDAEVKLSIVELGGVKTPFLPTLAVRRYPTTAELEKHAGENGEMAALAVADAPEATALEAKDLCSFSEEGRSIASDSPGRWTIRYSDLKPGPWLLLGWSDEMLQFRPTLLTVPGAIALPSGSLGEAIAEKDPDRRTQLLDAFVKRLAHDWNAPGWTDFDAFAAYAGRIPFSAFDVMRALAQNVAAAAIAYLRAGVTRRALFQSMEEMLFLWSAIPARSWWSALDAWSRHLKRIETEYPQYASAERVRCQEQLRLAADGPIPSLAPILALGSRRIPRFEPFPNELKFFGQGVRQRLEQRLHELAKSLRQRHANDYWPTDFSFVADGMAAELRRLKVDVAIEYHRQVLEAPLRLASWTLDEHRPAITDPTVILQMKRVRAFDPEWFDEAHTAYLNLLLCQQLERDAKWFPDL